MKRYSGVLLSVSSLPSKYGIGCFDQAAYDFVDWLEKAGQKYWQILPLGATSHGGAYDSPYQAYSAFAGNPYFISLTALIEDHFTSKNTPYLHCGHFPFNESSRRLLHTLGFSEYGQHRFGKSVIIDEILFP